MDRVIKVLELAQNAKDAIKGKLAEEMDAAQAKVEAQLGLALDAFDDMSAPLIDIAETIERRARRRTQGQAVAGRAAGAGSAEKGAPRRGRRASARTVLTPISNRGVRSDHGKGKNPTSMRVSGHLAGEKSGTEKRAKKGARNGAV